MNGYDFKCFGEGVPTTQYSRAYEELERYMIRNYKYRIDLQYSITNMKGFVLDIQDDINI